MIVSRLARRVRSAVRRPVRTLMTPDPTTAPLPAPVGAEVPDDRHVTYRWPDLTQLATVYRLAEAVERGRLGCAGWSL